MMADTATEAPFCTSFKDNTQTTRMNGYDKTEKDVIPSNPVVSNIPNEEVPKSTSGGKVSHSGKPDKPPADDSISGMKTQNPISYGIERTTGITTNCNGIMLETTPQDVEDKTTFTFSKIPMCAVCSEPCICYCKSCKKVSYCSKEHQQQHWNDHRPECYPVTVQANQVFGSHLVVTRDIKRGEVILCENPLLSVPFYSTKQDCDAENSSIFQLGCLSCHKCLEQGDSHISQQTELQFPCSLCKWPICSVECEQNPIHADQECKVFAKHNFPPSAFSDKTSQFLCVALLRILHQKKLWDSLSTSGSLPLGETSNNSTWSRFMTVVNKQVPMKDGLNSQLGEAKKATTYFSDLIKKSLGSIIHTEFSATDAEIDQIIQTLRTSSFITDNNGYYMNGWSELFKNTHKRHHPDSYNDNSFRESEKRGGGGAGKFLTVYHLASMLTCNCVPNASWIIQESTLDFYLRASTPIKTGERISITFVDPLLGTRERRERLWKEKYLSCSCSRCSDPSESCTFFSAIKCPGKMVGRGQANGNESKDYGVICECEGYVVPTDPLVVTYASQLSPSIYSPSDAAQVALEKHEEREILPGEKLCEEKRGEWKCNVCSVKQSWSFVEGSLERMKKIFEGIDTLENVSFTMSLEENGCKNANKMFPEKNMTGMDRVLEILEARVYKIDSLVGNIAHSNHEYILKMENEVLSRISVVLERGQVPLKEMEKWALKMIELCKKGLKVVNVLCPGLSRERGHLLYYLQQALTISLLFKSSRAMRATNSQADLVSSTKPVNSGTKEVLSCDELKKKFFEIILARREVLEIFVVTKDNSIEKEMLKAVQRDSIEMKLLKNFFKTHQNIN